MKITKEMIEKFESIINKADKEGVACISSGLYVETSDRLVEAQNEWPDDDESAKADFTRYSYYITTDDSFYVGFDDTEGFYTALPDGVELFDRVGGV
jgi:hypothetical protein